MESKKQTQNTKTKLVVVELGGGVGGKRYRGLRYKLPVIK